MHAKTGKYYFVLMIESKMTTIIIDTPATTDCILVVKIVGIVAMSRSIT